MRNRSCRNINEMHSTTRGSNNTKSLTMLCGCDTLLIHVDMPHDLLGVHVC